MIMSSADNPMNINPIGTRKVKKITVSSLAGKKVTT